MLTSEFCTIPALRSGMKNAASRPGNAVCVLTARRDSGSHRRMIHRLIVAFSFILITAPAFAIVGGGGAPAENIARAVVTIIGSRGTFCSGALIAADIVLTAAHCVLPGADYKVIIPGETPPRLLEVKRTVSHPQFSVQAILAHRASADVALLQLDTSPSGKSPAPLGPPLMPIQPGDRLTIAGVGVTARGDGKTGG